MSKKGTYNKKKRLEVEGLSKKDMMRVCRETEDMDVILEYTHH